MHSAREALLGFTDKEAEARYGSHLKTQIKPWILQVSSGSLFACIAVARAGPAWDFCSLSVALFLGAAFLGLFFYKNLQRLSGTFVVAFVYAVYSFARLICTTNVTLAPVIRKLFVGGEPSEECACAA